MALPGICRTTLPSFDEPCYGAWLPAGVRTVHAAVQGDPLDVERRIWGLTPWSRHV